MTEEVRTLADQVLDRLVRTFEAARDPARAVPMAAYMRDQFAFLGIATPTLRALSRTVLGGLPKPAEASKHL
jgi:3-methyladenine DNA glycosylase AlkD